MKEHDKVRKSVTNHYARVVSSPSGECCCGIETGQKGIAAGLAGYSREELEALPPEAVINSFGCGNPLAFSEIEEGNVVLDLGSGAGIDILLAGKKVGPGGRAIGIDMTDEMIEKARANIAASGLRNVEVRKGLIEELPVESGSVDWVVSNCVINLSPEKSRVFAEIARVLKPGGRMMVSDIVVEELPTRLRKSEALYGSCIVGAISEGEYLAGLRDAGLADVEVRERLVYDFAQLKALVSSELASEAQTFTCCGGVSGEKVVDETLESLSGKVWSARVYAQKPGD